MSLPVPPVRVSMLATVTVLAKLPRVRLSLPVPRSIEPLLIAAPRVTVSAPVPPVMVSVLETVALLVPLAKVSVSLPVPRSIEPCRQRYRA